MSDYESERLYQVRTTRLMRSCIEAISSHALALVIDASKSFGEAAVAIEPGEGSFHDPAAREDFKTGGMVGTLDDFDGPVTKLGERVAELLAGAR